MRCLGARSESVTTSCPGPCGAFGFIVTSFSTLDCPARRDAPEPGASQRQLDRGESHYCFNRPPLGFFFGVRSFFLVAIASSNHLLWVVVGRAQVHTACHALRRHARVVRVREIILKTAQETRQTTFRRP